jgi:biotin carboxyl carrier protein
VAFVDEREIAIEITATGVIAGGPHFTVVYSIEDGSIAVAELTSGSESAYRTFDLIPPPPLPRRVQAAREGVTLVAAPLAGTVSGLRVSEGEAVQAGQLLVLLEAMKMEHRIVAPNAGTVKAIPVHDRDVVREGDTLVELS